MNRRERGFVLSNAIADDWLGQRGRDSVAAATDAEEIEAVGRESLRFRKTSLKQPRVRFARLRQVLPRHQQVARLRVLDGEMIQVL